MPLHASLLPPLLSLARRPFAAFSLGMARALGLLQILPISTRLGLTGMHRAGVAAALSLLFVPMLLRELRPVDLSGARLALFAAKEGLIGFALGTIFALPFWAAETAGELLDFERGSRGAVTPDPAQQAESGTTATLLVLTLTTIFFLSGGMHWLIEALYQSYLAWPAGVLLPHFGAGAAMRLLGALDAVLAAGLLLASPLFVAMVFTDLVLAFIARFAPRLNVFDLSLAVKNLVEVIGLPIYAVFLIGYLRGSLAPLVHIGAELRLLAGR